VNSLLKVISGYWSDRVRHRRPIVIAGYALSSIARPFIALTTSWPQVLVIRALDRVGKRHSWRTRDVLLARFATPTTEAASTDFIARWITRRDRRSAVATSFCSSRPTVSAAVCVDG
jgi:MFS family permease